MGLDPVQSAHGCLDSKDLTIGSMHLRTRPTAADLGFGDAEFGCVGIRFSDEDAV